MENIVENYTFCVEEVRDNKIYLDPQKIQMLDGNLLLCLNAQGDYIRLPYLLRNLSGKSLTKSCNCTCKIKNRCPLNQRHENGVRGFWGL